MSKATQPRGPNIYFLIFDFYKEIRALWWKKKTLKGAFRLYFFVLNYFRNENTGQALQLSIQATEQSALRKFLTWKFFYIKSYSHQTLRFRSNSLGIK